MGFGILFIGYFLLLNLTYFGFTDLIAALIMLMAFYKLWSVEPNFRLASFAAGGLCAVGVIELYNEVIRMFFRSTPILTAVVAPLRYVMIGLITVFMLLGIRALAREVGIGTLARRCTVTMPISAAAFLLMTVLEVPALCGFINRTALGVISIILLLISFVLLIINLITVYTAYMRICMPEDVDNEAPQRASRFGFVNKFKAHEEEKQREYAEYKLEKFKKNQTKTKKKK